MPRKPRQVSPTGFYHFIVRGLNKKDLFHRKKDYQYFLSLLKEYSEKFNLCIYHYCLMTNHAHLLLKADCILDLSRFGHFIQRRYAYYYCKTYKWSEQVFRKRFLSLSIDKDSYLLECGRYIERNPLKAKMVQKAEDYPYSSYSFYAYNKPNPLITPSPLYLDMARSEDQRKLLYRFYVNQDRETEKELIVPF